MVKPSMTTASGLVLTASAPTLKHGKVVAVGPG